MKNRIKKSGQIVFAILMIVVFNSCSNHEVPIAKENCTDKINEYFKNFNNYEWDKLASLYAESCKVKDPSDPSRKTITRSEIVKKYTELHKSIPDVRDSVVTVYNFSPVIVVEFISKGTDPGGNKFELPICAIFEFNREGKIIKDFTYYDNF